MDNNKSSHFKKIDRRPIFVALTFTFVTGLLYFNSWIDVSNQLSYFFNCPIDGSRTSMSINDFFCSYRSSQRNMTEEQKNKSTLVIAKSSTKEVTLSHERNVTRSHGSHVTLSHERSVTRSPAKRYVTLCQGCFNSRRSGNQLFNLVGLLYIQKMDGRIPIMSKNVPHGWLESIINHKILLVDKIKPNYCPCEVINEGHNYEPIFSNLSQPYFEKFTTLEICGYMQNWRYVDAVKKEFLEHLNFKPDVEKGTRDLLRSQVDILRRKFNWTMAPFDVRFVGLHNRRGDFLIKSQDFGVVTEQYIRKAIFFYLDIRMRDSKKNASNTILVRPDQSNISYRDAGLAYHLIFVVCSDDIPWTKSVIAKMGLSLDGHITFFYSNGKSAAFDLRLLSQCNDSIITVGTFSWWSGYLAGGRVVYYKNYPKKEKLSDADRLNYYPHNWTPME